MSAFFYGVILQWKQDLRSREVLLIYYIVPLVFFTFMGGIFTSIDPEAKETLLQSMTVFGVTMGAILGTPVALVELYGSEVKKAYKVGGIPLWAAAANNYISAVIHLFLMSIIIYLIAPIAFHAHTPNNTFVYFVSLLLFIVTSVAIGTVLGLFIRKASRVTMFGQFIFLPSVMLSGIMFPSSMLPTFFQYSNKVLPATWGFELMKEETFQFISMMPLIILLLIAIFFIILKLKDFKKAS